AGILFISGVHTDVPTDAILKMWTGGLDTPVCCVELGRKAQTTSENAQETQEWMEKKKFSSLRLVTSNYHMHRAMLEISHALPDAIIIPHAVIQTDIPADSLHMWALLFSEYHKTIARWMAFTFGLPVTGGTS
ncbi:MAG: YdcF family protein, partial [Alphaproteobacteria bacterium]|nr:YdcF family protein [Alphaproteobacteria bacterium]